MVDDGHAITYTQLSIIMRKRKKKRKTKCIKRHESAYTRFINLLYIVKCNKKTILYVGKQLCSGCL